MVALETVLQVIPAISVSIAAIYYALNIRHQRETRQAQLFYGIYDRTSQTDFIDAWSAFMSWEWESYDEYMEIWSDRETFRHAWILGTFFEGLGVLVRLKLVHIQHIALFITSMTRTYWEKIAQVTMEYREREKVPRSLGEAEYLYNELMKYIEEHPELKT